MPRLICVFICFVMSTPSWGQVNFQWSQEVNLPYQDSLGQNLTGTEIMHIISHKGELFAGNSYWGENSDPRQGQVWHKNNYAAQWALDFQMPAPNSRVPSLNSFIFQRDYQGLPIRPDTLLLAGATI